jgi:sulfite exporter TauE/SafE
MTALISAVFIASLLGSMHCAGMCGAFLAFAVASDDKARPHPLRSRAALNAAYNGGRLLTYTILGAISGTIGAAVDLGAGAVGIQRAAAMLAGAMMVAFGVIAILRLRGVHVPHMPLPTALRTAVMRGHRAASDLPPLGRALSIGLLTTLLPCGWLYAFVITAAGTASPLLGAVTMAAFWLGTLPIMLTLGTGIQALAGPLRAKLPLVTSILLVTVGLYTLAGRMAMPAIAAGDSTQNHTDTTTAVERVNSLSAEEMPCCHGD